MYKYIFCKIYISSVYRLSFALNVIYQKVFENFYNVIPIYYILTVLYIYVFIKMVYNRMLFL